MAQLEGDMIDLEIEISPEDEMFITSGKNKIAYRRRIGKVTGIRAGSLYTYLESLPTFNTFKHKLITCGFCNKLRLFSSYKYVIKDGRLFITNIEYDNPIHICSRPDTKTCVSRKMNPNSIELVRVAYGFQTDEEANNYILTRNKSPFYRTNHSSDEEYKKAQTRDIDFYGSKERFDAVKRKMSHSSSHEVMLEKYGSERLSEINKSKDSSSKDFFKKKYGKLWEEHYQAKCKQSINNLEVYIARYGKEEGKVLYDEKMERQKQSHAEFIKNSTKEQRSLLFDSTSKKYFKRLYGDNWKIHYSNKQKSQCKCSRASKESLKFFDLLVEKMPQLEYNIGIEGNQEFYIYDHESNRIKYYDFCIRTLNIIIEFHGSIWHYNPSYEYKRKLPFNQTHEEHKIIDKHKEELARSAGFDYYVVFDTDNYDDKSTELSEIIIERLTNEKE